MMAEQTVLMKTDCEAQVQQQQTLRAIFHLDITLTRLEKKHTPDESGVDLTHFLLSLSRCCLSTGSRLCLLLNVRVGTRVQTEVMIIF